jgi:hypothetical protein
MRVQGALVREAGEHAPPQSLFRRIRSPRGRPVARYRALVRSASDVRRLRRRRVPVYLLTDEWVGNSGYPTRFRPWLVVAESIAPLLDSSFRVLPVRDPGSVESPGLPELVSYLLRVDPLAARAVALRNRSRLNRSELYRRIRNERLEGAATRVRLQEVVPELPEVGEPLPLEDLEYVDENNPALREPR